MSSIVSYLPGEREHLLAEVDMVGLLPETILIGGELAVFLRYVDEDEGRENGQSSVCLAEKERIAIGEARLSQEVRKYRRRDISVIGGAEPKHG
jgi:hypothetical protein